MIFKNNSVVKKDTLIEKSKIFFAKSNIIPTTISRAVQVILEEKV